MSGWCARSALPTIVLLTSCRNWDKIEWNIGGSPSFHSPLYLRPTVIHSAHVPKIGVSSLFWRQRKQFTVDNGATRSTALVSSAMNDAASRCLNVAIPDWPHRPTDTPRKRCKHALAIRTRLRMTVLALWWRVRGALLSVAFAACGSVSIGRYFIFQSLP